MSAEWCYDFPMSAIVQSFQPNRSTSELGKTLDRVSALERYAVLDTPAEPHFDDIARLAAQAFDAPIAVVNLIASERQWFKAEVGIGARELPLDVSICVHALLEDDMLIIRDTRLDPRVSANPLITAEDGLRFYAGALLKTPEGVAIGTVCVLDRTPRPEGVTEFQRLTLEVLARQVMVQLELRRTLIARREAEHRNRLILDSAHDSGIVTLDLAGIVTSWNLAASRLMGWTEEEICGQHCETFFTPEDCAAGTPAWEMAAAMTNQPGIDERWHLRKNGSRFWASGEMMALTADNGTHIGYLKILRDRTRRHVVQAALSVSEARTRQALEAAEMGAWEISPASREIIWDARTRELLGHTPDEPLDFEHSFLARVDHKDRERVAALHAEALAQGGSGAMHIEYRVISAIDGRERWVQTKGAPAQGSDGNVRYFGTVRDISAEKEAEHHRQLLVAELQHRTKNTLAVVQAIVNQSLRQAKVPKDVRQTIDDRLYALSSADDLLVQTNWTSASIRQIVERGIKRHGIRDGGIRARGPDLDLSARAALALSMSLHELTTNAVKYGALSLSEGHVELDWSIAPSEAGEVLSLHWQEKGGPKVISPERRGFGTHLLEALTRDLGGTTVLDYFPDGVVWQLSARIDGIAP